MSDKTIKVRMLDGIFGMFEGMPNGVKRGDVVELSEDHGNRYVANELATVKHLKADLADLSHPYTATQESQAMREKLAPKDRERLEQIKVQSGQKETVVVGSPHPRGPQGGWLGP